MFTHVAVNQSTDLTKYKGAHVYTCVAQIPHTVPPEVSFVKSIARLGMEGKVG